MQHTPITRRVVITGLAVAGTSIAMPCVAVAPDLGDPNTDKWQFEIGQWVTHKDQPMPSLVLSRAKTGKLGELYGVRSFAFEDPQRDRMILGSSLKPIDAEAKSVSLVHTAGLA